CAIIGVLEHRPVSFQAGGVDTSVGTASAGQFAERVVNVNLVEVQNFISAGLLPGHLEPEWHMIDRDHALCAEEACACDRKLSHRPASPDCDHVSGLDIAHLGSHVSGGKDI